MAGGCRDGDCEGEVQALGNLIAFHEGTYNLFPERTVEEANQQLSMSELFEMMEQERPSFNPAAVEEPAPIEEEENEEPEIEDREDEEVEDGLEAGAEDEEAPEQSVEETPVPSVEETEDTHEESATPAEQGIETGTEPAIDLPALSVGMSFEVEGRTFTIDSISPITRQVSLMDNTYSAQNGYPIFRSEPYETVQAWLLEVDNQRQEPETIEQD